LVLHFFPGLIGKGIIWPKVCKLNPTSFADLSLRGESLFPKAKLGKDSTQVFPGSWGQGIPMGSGESRPSLNWLSKKLGKGFGKPPFFWKGKI